MISFFLRQYGWLTAAVLAVYMVGGAGLLVWGRTTGHPQAAAWGNGVVATALAPAVLFVVLCLDGMLAGSPR